MHIVKACIINLISRYGCKFILNKFCSYFTSKELYGCFFEGFLCFYLLNWTILRRLYICRKLPLSLSLGCAALLNLDYLGLFTRTDNVVVRHGILLDLDD